MMKCPFHWGRKPEYPEGTDLHTESNDCMGWFQKWPLDGRTGPVAYRRVVELTRVLLPPTNVVEHCIFS